MILGTMNASAQEYRAWGQYPTYHEIQSTLQVPTIEDTICSYAWDCQTALRVARCESTMNPRAYNNGNYGLFQINGIHAARVQSLEALYDANTNIQVAFQIYSEQGWRPWACY